MSMFSKLKQFKDLRSQGKKLQGALEGETVTASELGNKVVLIMDGNMKIAGLTIDKEVMNPENKERVEKGIKDAHDEALKKMQRIIAKKMQSLGMDLPGMGK